MKLPRLHLVWVPLLVPGLLAAAAPVSLFDGHDLAGWRVWLGRRPADLAVAGLARDASGRYADAIGYDRDAYGVFSVVSVDGQPAIRISGRIGGGLVSDRSFANYRLRLRYRWGRAPAKGRSNSGIAYDVTGEPTLAQPWASAHEFQVRGGETGDYWCQGDALAEIHARRIDGGDFIYDPTAALVTFSSQSGGPRHCAKAFAAESPAGQWTTLELVCFGDQSAQLVNGRVVLRIRRSRRRTPTGLVPLDSGRIMLQSEGGEIFLREIELIPLDTLPRELADD